jgi:ribosomal protein L11 methyltransferase
MQYLQFLFNSASQEQKDILIAILSEESFAGFEEDETGLKAFIPTKDFNEVSFNNIIKVNSLEYTKSIINEINWNEKWERNFDPVIVLYPDSEKTFAKVRASFHQPDKEVLHEIIVTPKMSFGTGHHATTYLMMEQMSRMQFSNKTVIDFGTGTGVLAILAEKMGATNIIAIDNDDWSINNAKENIEANNCTKIQLQKAETLSGKIKADIILANINLNVIIANLNEIIAACNNYTNIVFCGILVPDKAAILKALVQKNLQVHNIRERNNWLLLQTNYSKD